MPLDCFVEGLFGSSQHPFVDFTADEREKAIRLVRLYHALCRHRVSRIIKVQAMPRTAPETRTLNAVL